MSGLVTKYFRARFVQLGQGPRRTKLTELQDLDQVDQSCSHPKSYKLIEDENDKFVVLLIITPPMFCISLYPHQVDARYVLYTRQLYSYRAPVCFFSRDWEGKHQVIEFTLNVDYSHSMSIHKNNIVHSVLLQVK